MRPALALEVIAPAGRRGAGLHNSASREFPIPGLLQHNLRANVFNVVRHAPAINNGG